ncbi:MAG: PEGA domain-containing protein, partial [Deltaproteobacteria bacterium]|nr:PEGA domain-containing protein [Deltaproteobacteria bacterium]
GDPAPIAEPPADMHFDEPVDATGRSVGGRTPRGDPRPAATTRTNELAPARLGMGQVNLLALPAADVTWRGRAMGRTPLALRLPAGRHRLSLRAARGGATTTITVEVRPGRTARRTVRLE